MPRTSEKAKITTQLSHIWLANEISRVLNCENDLPFRLFSTRAQGNLRRRELVGQEAMGEERVGGSMVAFDQHMLDFGFGGFEDGNKDAIQGLGGIEESDEEEIMEGVERLCVFVSSIRYLAQREPIPRSEYLFNYHVCIKEN